MLRIIIRAFRVKLEVANRRGGKGEVLTRSVRWGGVRDRDVLARIVREDIGCGG